MFESIEIRKVKNGYVVQVATDDGVEEHVFLKAVHVYKFLKDYVN